MSECFDKVVSFQRLLQLWPPFFSPPEFGGHDWCTLHCMWLWCIQTVLTDSESHKVSRRWSPANTSHETEREKSQFRIELSRPSYTVLVSGLDRFVHDVTETHDERKSLTFSWKVIPLYSHQNTYTRFVTSPYFIQESIVSQNQLIWKKPCYVDIKASIYINIYHWSLSLQWGLDFPYAFQLLSKSNLVQTMLCQKV